MGDDVILSPVQLSLGVTLKDDATFANFYAEEGSNIEVVSVLKSIAAGNECTSHLIWGIQGCGLTHLMQALCHEAHELHRPVQYLPMRDIRGYAATDICEGIDESSIVCIDGIDLVCGMQEWELALFHLFNKMRDRGHAMLMGAHMSPGALPIELADLKSRVKGSVVYHVESLDDEDKQNALIMRAKARGMNMPSEVAKYILTHSSRDMNDLFYLLNRLDDVSIQQQRKLTIPFIKEALGI